jgi:hypothetical protein
LKNNIAQIRDLIGKGHYSDLAQKLKDGNINIDAIAAEEYNQMLEIERRLKLGSIDNPLPYSQELPYGCSRLENDEHRGTWSIGLGKFSGLYIMGSIAIYENLAWYHVSFSRRGEMPNYRDVKLVKDYWFGDDRWAIQVHPKASEHVNIAPTCLHLWNCLEDGFHLPDFRTHGAI